MELMANFPISASGQTSGGKTSNNNRNEAGTVITVQPHVCPVEKTIVPSFGYRVGALFTRPLSCPGH